MNKEELKSEFYKEVQAAKEVELHYSTTKSWKLASYHEGRLDAFRFAYELIDQLDESKPQLSGKNKLRNQVGRLINDRYGEPDLKSRIEQQAYLNVRHLIDQLDEPEKVVVPQFVADWVEKCKKRNWNLFGLYRHATGKVESWIFDTPMKSERIELIGRAFLDGYTVEEKRKYKLTLERDTIELDVIEDERPTETENRIKEQLDNVVYWEEVDAE